MTKAERVAVVQVIISQLQAIEVELMTIENDDEIISSAIGAIVGTYEELREYEG